MSVRALTWSFNLLLPDMAAKAVLNALADHADETGQCWPSTARMARFAGCEEKTVRRALVRLVGMGLVEREARSGKSDVFRLNLNATVADDPSLNAPLPDCPPLPETTPPNEGLTQDFEAQTPPNKAQDPPHVGTRTTKNRHKKNHQEPSTELRAKLPGDWRPNPDDRAYAIDKGLDPESTAAAFTDYFSEGRGRGEKRTAAGWSKRWRVWCNTDADRRGQRPAQFESASDKRTREIKEAIERSKLQ